MIAYPQVFGGSKARSSWIADQFDEASRPHLFGHPATLCVAALIGPDDARSQDLVVFIQQDNAVHLAGEANALDILRLNVVAYSTHQAGTNGSDGSTPPVSRVLFGPA